MALDEAASPGLGVVELRGERHLLVPGEGDRGPHGGGGIRSQPGPGPFV
ncbi:hypothetical protein ABT224_35765 [Streptomyces sp. NPDC001584]